MQSNTSVIHVNSTETIPAVEICGKLFSLNLMRRNEAAGALRGARAPRGTPGMNTCSACAGDYEDPDRTAWVTDREVEDVGTTQAEGEEFPDES